MDQQVCGIPAELWKEYGALQRQADRAKLDSYTWGIDDQLQHFLDAIEGCLPETSEARSKLLHNLVLNRTKKHSRRSRKLELYRPALIELDPEREITDRLHAAQTVARVHSLAARQEWKILLRLADGEEYDAVARAEKMNTSTLKSQVCRCRIRLARLAA
jgi:uncharacterized protein YerC